MFICSGFPVESAPSCAGGLPSKTLGATGRIRMVQIAGDVGAGPHAPGHGSTNAAGIKKSRQAVNLPGPQSELS